MSLDETEKRLLGASDMATLLGLSPWSGPVALWARVVHGWEAATTHDQDEGTAAEAYNRICYRNRTGYTLAGSAKWRHPLYPWARCSPDDTATDTPDGRRGVELKRYNWLEGWGAPGTDVVPADIWVQVQFQAGVALDLGEWDAAGVDVSALLRGELRIYHVPHIPEVYERCIAVAERFWRDFVVPMRCPDGDNLVLLERDAEALKALFHAPKVETALQWEVLTEAQRATVAQWLEANAAERAWKKQAKALKVKMQHLLREHPALLLPEGMSARRVSFGEQDGAPHLDVKALRAALGDEDPTLARRMDELIRKHTTQETTRPLVAR